MANEKQAAVWNDVVGDAWVRHGRHYDATLEPFGRAVMERLGVTARERVLDIGCGTGTTALELAKLASAGEVVGIDLSEPMASEARRRINAAPVHNARILVGDVQALAPAEGPFDAAFSRFGVMFFEDPDAAFGAIRSSLRPGGRLGFCCFADLGSNPLIGLTVGSVLGVLDLGEMPGPDEPGPFSLSDPDHVRGLLTRAGFTGIELDRGPEEGDLGPADDLVALAQQLLEQNPITGPAIARATADQRDAALAATAETLAAHREGDRVVAGASVWIVTALHPA
jgi:SAM-dependent methyltransferase